MERHSAGPSETTAWRSSGWKKTVGPPSLVSCFTSEGTEAWYTGTHGKSKKRFFSCGWKCTSSWNLPVIICELFILILKLSERNVILVYLHYLTLKTIFCCSFACLPYAYLENSLSVELYSMQCIIFELQNSQFVRNNYMLVRTSIIEHWNYSCCS
jgi:hypothetical protein